MKKKIKKINRKLYRIEDNLENLVINSRVIYIVLIVIAILLFKIVSKLG